VRCLASEPFLRLTRDRWDTAGLYGAGTNEEMLGKFIKEHNCRDKIFIASKWVTPLSSCT
jgi:aryl-alcohol dehydrogenase-like predicted oxidoreductase